jgi:hypothetical protein
MRGRHPDGWSRISNFHISCMRVRTVIFELRFLPYVWSRPDGKPHRPDGVSIFPYSELGKNLKLINHWWSSERAAEMSGRMQAGTEASRYSEGSGRKDMSSVRMMLFCLASGQDEHVVRTDGTVDRWTSGWDDTSSGRLAGNLKSSIFFVVQSLLKMLWQMESLFTASLHISDFVQTQNEAKILTIFLPCILFDESPFLSLDFLLVALRIFCRYILGMTEKACHCFSVLI